MGQNQESNYEEFEKKCKEALELFSINTFIDKKIYTLSGGEKRRVELAQVFLTKPDILLLDEPTANLDVNNKKAMINIIGNNFYDTTIILVSHDDNKYFSDYISMELKKGKLIV